METRTRPGPIRILLLLGLIVAVPLGWIQAASGAEPRPAAAPAAASDPAPSAQWTRVSVGVIRAAATVLPARSARVAPAEHRSALLVRIPRTLAIRARPGGGRLVGWLPASSRYYHVPTVAWIRRTTREGRFGLVSVPYSRSRRSGWIALAGLDGTRTAVEVRVDLSRRMLILERRGRPLFRFPVAVGAASSPTPPGRYFVTDRVPFASGSVYGTFAFGISGIQPRLPAGWTGGDQLAIHGTDVPSSIGTASSAGCLRVTERALARLRPVLRLGTPVIVVP